MRECDFCGDSYPDSELTDTIDEEGLVGEKGSIAVTCCIHCDEYIMQQVMPFGVPPDHWEK